MRLVIFLISILSIDCLAQELTGKLVSPTCIVFRNIIYVIGYNQNDAGSTVCITGYSDKLEKITANELGIGKASPASFLSPQTDTTHGYLSVIIQLKNNGKSAIVFRFDENLKLRMFSKDADITRINSFAAFEEEKLFYKNQLYVAKQAGDSVGRFYFYRYDLKDSSVLFTYNFNWQFNFDKYTYHLIHPVYADGNRIYLYVICTEGEKRGQWLLALNTDDGSLAKAMKLNKNENEMCFVSRVLVYGHERDIAIGGVKYPAANVDLQNGKFAYNYIGSKTVNTFFCRFDSAGELKTRFENYISMPNELIKEKEIKELLFRCNLLKKEDNGFSLNYECLYRGQDNLYKTYGFLFSKLNETPEESFKPDNSAFLATYRNEKKNPACKETMNQYDNDKSSKAVSLFYKEPMSGNFTGTGTLFDVTKKLTYQVSYHKKMDSAIELYKYTMKNYVWETASLKVTEPGTAIMIQNMGGNIFILFSSKEDGSFIMNRLEL